MSDVVEIDMNSLVEDLQACQHRAKDEVVQSVLELLAMTMFADKQVLAAEIQAFVSAVINFQNEYVLTSQMSEAEIIHWYESHKSKLAELVRHKAFEPWMESKIDELTDFPDKHLLLRAMDEIAHADGEKHVSEQALEVLTAQKWADALLKKYSKKWVA